MKNTLRARLASGVAAIAGAVALGVTAVIASVVATDARAAGAKPVVVVIGATGRTGGEAVAQLAAQGAWSVRALVRDPAKAAKLPSGVEVVRGDVRDPATLAAALRGATYVIAAAGSTGGAYFGDNSPEKVDYEGTKNVAEAAKAAGVKRVCLVSSMGVTHSDHPLNKRLNNIFDWKLKGENALRASGVGYTIVRPGGLRDEPGGRVGVRAMQGDTLQSEGTIPRADVAAACIASLDLKAADRVTFEVVSAPGTPPADWPKVYAGLQPDAAGR
jgi:uncharacterized protein YbjT (DUF2867 family)